MPTHSQTVDDLVAASRILASQGVCDAFGHVSARNPNNPGTYLLSCARAPQLVERTDIMEFELDGTPVGGDSRKPFLERFIHGSLYESRPDVQSVIHSHSRSVIPFTITQTKLRPVVHSSATIGHEVPVWDAQTKFGDTNLLIANMDMGRDFAQVLGAGNSALMRGHGSTVVGSSIRGAVYAAVYLEVNAGLQIAATALGPITFLSEGEINKIHRRLEDAKPGEGYDRAWAYWCHQAGLLSEPEA